MEEGKDMQESICLIGHLLRHEQAVWDGHRHALSERWALARRARNLGELVNAQLDLLPETRRRLQRDHATRRELLQALGRTLRRRRSRV